MPAAPVQREGEQLPGRLPQRSLADQVGGVGDDLVLVPRLDEDPRALLDRGDPRLAEALALQLRVRAGDGGVRLALPQAQAQRERVDRAFQVAVLQAPARLGAAPLERQAVDIGLVELQPVAARGGDQQVPCRTEGAAQPGDVGVQVALRGGGRPRAPHGVGQLAVGDLLGGVADEHGERGALPCGAECDFGVAEPRPERAQHIDSKSAVHLAVPPGHARG